MMDYLFGISNSDWNALSTIATFTAVIVAIVVPLLILRLNNRPKKSRLVFKEVSVISQKPSRVDEPSDGTLLHVGRIVVENRGKYKATMVEPYLDKIHWDADSREDYIPIPLVWSHGQLNKHSPTVRDIYPNQSVYLDVFKHVFDSAFVGNGAMIFSVAAGHGVDELSRVNFGESKALIKLFQESGQVDWVWVHIKWQQVERPQMELGDSGSS